MQKTSWEKTLCHYGAGILAIDETLEMTRIVIKAAGTYDMFGCRVILNVL